MMMLESQNSLVVPGTTMLKPLRLDENAPWKQRYRVPNVAVAQLARSSPGRGVVTSTRTG
jgi:hypothetical protein